MQLKAAVGGKEGVYLLHYGPCMVVYTGAPTGVTIVGSSWGGRWAGECVLWQGGGVIGCGGVIG